MSSITALCICAHIVLRSAPSIGVCHCNETYRINRNNKLTSQGTLFVTQLRYILAWSRHRHSHTHGPSNRYDFLLVARMGWKETGAAFKRYCFCLIITLILVKLPVCHEVFGFHLSFVVFYTFAPLLLCAHPTHTHMYTNIQN